TPHTPPTYSPSLYLSLFLLHWSGDLRDLHSFPTRRSSDLVNDMHASLFQSLRPFDVVLFVKARLNLDNRSHLLALFAGFNQRLRDRKSTRLNSSHSQISYAVFCLKKKKT